MKSITFDDGSKKFVLSLFNKSTDSEGYIVDTLSDNQRVPSTDGQAITIDQLAGIAKGSELYVKSDVASLVDLYERLKSEKAV